MSHDQDEQHEQRYRLAAAECLEEANRTSDQDVRTRLLIIAQKWFELANGIFAKRQQPPRSDAPAELDRDQHSNK
jgi:hypothetical protein